MKMMNCKHNHKEIIMRLLNKIIITNMIINLLNLILVSEVLMIMKKFELFMIKLLIL